MTLIDWLRSHGMTEMNLVGWLILGAMVASGTSILLWFLVLVALGNRG